MNQSLKPVRWLALCAAACGLLCASAQQAGAMIVAGLEAIPTVMGGVYLRWIDGTTVETGFRIELKTAGTEFVELVTTPPNSPLYTVTGLQPATDYTFRVTAVTDRNLPGTTIQVTTLPEYRTPTASPHLQWDASGKLRLRFGGEGATYTVQQSADLAAWSDVGEPLYLDSYQDPYDLEVPGAAPHLYRVQSTGYERPAAIGLSMPFELPPEPAGTVWNVTEFGSSPANINAGNDDAIGIKTAISIAQPGDIVYIPAGTYHIRQLLTIPTGVTLRGAGMRETVLITQGLGLAIQVAGLSHDIRIEQFTLTYAGTTEEFQNGIYVGPSRTGNNAYRIVIDRVRVERFSVFGISLRDCHHVLVQNCEMANATNLGGGGHGYGIALNYPTNHNNWIRHNKIGPVIRHAILLQYYCHNNLIEHNEAFNIQEDAYDLHGEDEYNNELRFNLARDSSYDGFGVGNTGATHDRSGPNNWIHHNTVERCLHGIEVIQDSDIVFIDHNIFRSNQYGIRVHNLGGKLLYIRDNLLQQNRIGFSVTTSRWIWLLDNHFDGQTQYAVEILGGTADLVDQGNIFTGNNLNYRP